MSKKIFNINTDFNNDIDIEDLGQEIATWLKEINDKPWVYGDLIVEFLEK